MKIGILTHFLGFQDSYALHVGWLERAKLLEYFGQDFDFLVDHKCPEGLYPNQKSILPRIKESRDFEAKVTFFEEAYKALLKDYDAILTADIMYQSKNNFLCYNQAVRNAAKELKAHWYHWIHSSWNYRPNGIRYPETLRYDYMEGSKIIYLSSYELNQVAQMYNTSPKNVYCVYNPKDVRSFFDFDPLAWKICKELELWKKDVVQIFPHCSTRMKAKGVHAIAKVFSALKRAGLQVAIIFANANSRSVQNELAEFKKHLETKYKLYEGYDFIFTSDMMENFKPLPRKAVADLYRVANLFVFGSWRETVGNAFQEAMISDNLLVLNQNVPSNVEMAGRDAIYFEYHYVTPGKLASGPAKMQSGNFKVIKYGDGSLEHEEGYFDNIAKRIIGILPSREHIWKFSYEWIWENQLRPLLYGVDI